MKTIRLKKEIKLKTNNNICFACGTMDRLNPISCYFNFKITLEALSTNDITLNQKIIKKKINNEINNFVKLNNDVIGNNYISEINIANPLIKEGVKTHLNGEIHFKVLRPDLFNLKTLSDKSEVIAKNIENIVVTELTGLCKIKIRKNDCKNK